MKKGASRPALRRGARIAAGVPFEWLQADAVTAIRSRPEKEPVAIACSGGADSVALLWFLWSQFPERRGRWLVLHFDHRLRGRASSADAAYVRRLALRLGERCIVGRWDRRSPAASKPSEAEARDARWQFFNQAMAGSGARVIALGHQLDDVAETMLMRLTRGSGTGGLAAPRPVQPMGDGTTRVRPLLALSARSIRSLLKDLRIPWREDASNHTDDFFRNRIRHRVLPALVAAAPQDALSGCAAARALLEEDDEALECWLDRLFPPKAGRMPPDLFPLRGLPAALARRAFHRWVRSAGLAAPPARAAVDPMVAAIVAGRNHRLSAGAGRFIAFDGRRLSLVEAGAPVLSATPWGGVPLSVDHVHVGPRGDWLTVRRVQLTARLFARIAAGDFPPTETVFLDLGSGAACALAARSWQSGDRYQPLGAPGRAKLQDLFVNRRIPRELRPLLPVVTGARGGVLWVPGLPPAQEVAIQPSSKLVVQLTYAPAPPTVHRLTADF